MRRRGHAILLDWTTLFLHLWRLARPEFWLVCIVPFYVGFVVASRTLLPGLDTWTEFGSAAVRDGATTHEFLQAWTTWWPQGRPLVLGILALGPLIWGSTLVYNDYWDYHADRRNPRRSKSLLVRNLITRRAARAWAWVLGASGLLVAGLVSTTLVLLYALCLVLSWAYSAPPLRLKTRPGMDVAVNAVGIGFLCALAGWSLARPVSEFHPAYFVQGTLVFVGLYLPTTLVDYPYDKESGLETFAVRFGPRVTFWVGFAAFAAATAGTLLFALNDFVIPRSFLPILLPFDLGVLLQYYLLIGRYDSPRSLFLGIGLVAFTLLLSSLLFAVAYTGLWKP